jgi:hypothetical protein
MMSVTEIENMRALRGWLLALVLAALAVVISYYWLDRPIALFVHSQFPRNIRVLLEPVTYIPNPLIWLATITFLAFGIRGLAGRPLSKMQTAILLCSVSLIVAETIRANSNSCLVELGQKPGVKIIRRSFMMEFTGLIGSMAETPINHFHLDT